MAYISLDNNNLDTIDIEWDDNHCGCHCFFYESDDMGTWCRLGLDGEETTGNPSPSCPGPGTYILKLEKIDV
jgi:hypothetical protein